jgi:RNA polymerase sigma-70 factor (ECF subfamily)
MGSSGDGLPGQAAGGDVQLLARLLEEHTPGIRQQIVRKIPRRWRSVLSVEDVLQQTYTDAFLSFSQFDPAGRASFATWLAALARCNLIDALRMLEADKRGKGWRQIPPEAGGNSCAGLYHALGATRGTPSRHAARDEARCALEFAILQLPETYRRVVQMYDIENQPAGTVARALGRSPGAIYMIRARAHRRLRELLGNTSKYLSAR